MNNENSEDVDNDLDGNNALDIHQDTHVILYLIKTW
jgi:hypothetical protein